MLFLLVHYHYFAAFTANNLVDSNETEAVAEDFAAKDPIPVSPSPSESISQVSSTPAAKKEKSCQSYRRGID